MISLPKNYLGKAIVSGRACWTTQQNPDGTIGTHCLLLGGTEVTVLGPAFGDGQSVLAEEGGRKLRIAREGLEAPHSSWACAARPHGTQARVSLRKLDMNQYTKRAP